MSLKSGLVVVSLALSVVIGLVLARGRAPADAGGGTHAPVIGLSLETLKEPRWHIDRDDFIAAVEKQGGTVHWQDADGSETQQISDVKSLLSQHVDVLVIVAHDGKAMASAVRLAHDVGIPVIAYDRLVNDSDVDFYLSFDNVRVGRLQAQYLIDHLPTPGHGKIIRVYGAKTDNNASLFKQGQDEALKPYLDRGDIKVIAEDWAEDWRPEMAKRIVSSAITKNGTDFDAVLASNDGTASGAIKALEEAGVAGKVLVTGQDADLPACQDIVRGVQTMTIYKPVSKLAARAADIAVAMARHKPVIATSSVNNGKEDIPSVILDVIAVDKSNLSQTVIADGFHGKKEVYGSD